MFNWLRETDEKRYKIFLNLFSTNSFSRDKINHEDLFKKMEKALDEDREVRVPELHNLFELLIYLFSLSNDAEYLFERYHYKYPDRALQMLQRAKEADCDLIIDCVDNFIESYDIINEQAPE